MNVSRWLNGFTLITNTSKLELKNTYEFIKDIRISKSTIALKDASKLVRKFHHFQKERLMTGKLILF